MGFLTESRPSARARQAVLAIILLTASTYGGCHEPRISDLHSVVVGGNYDALKNIGVKGDDGFDSKRRYLIVLTPTIEQSSPTGVKIPTDIVSAVDELRRALPRSYAKSLQWVSSRQKAQYCASPDEEIDILVVEWLKRNWRLRDSLSPLVLEFGFETLGELYPDLVANAIVTRLCPERRPKN